MAKTLAIRALQRGVGSMDYVDSLLLMEPEDESKNSDQEPNVADDDDASPLWGPPASTQVIAQLSQFQNGATVVAVVQCP